MFSDLHTVCMCTKGENMQTNLKFLPTVSLGNCWTQLLLTVLRGRHTLKYYNECKSKE